jgi:hypothetical protein
MKSLKTCIQQESPRQAYLYVIAIFCLGLIFWAGSDVDKWLPSYSLNSNGGDYYHLLVDGFLDGQMHMKVPRTPSGELPVLMDASIYKGKYYMYFGVTPALLTLIPYRLITGYHLSLNFAVFALVAAGFMANVLIYKSIRDRYFHYNSRFLEITSISLLAFGSSTPTLVFNPGMYELALAAGYLCISIALLALNQALHNKKNVCPWILVASFWIGISVGCRPTYVLALPILLIPSVLHLINKKNNINLSYIYNQAKSAIIPAVLIGLGLMSYNFSRFENPLEFGFKYQENALMSSGLPFVRANFMWPNLTWYYLTPPVLSPHFPYVLPINASNRPIDYYGYERIHGQWITLLLAFLILIGIIWTRKRQREIPINFKALIISILILFGSVFLALLTFGFRANRYVSDFQPALILGLTLIGGYIAAEPRAKKQIFNKLFTLTFAGLSICIAVFNYLIGIQWMDRLANTRPKIFEQLAYYGNYPSHWLNQLGVNEYGPIKFEATFPIEQKSGIEPLISCGTDTYTDIIYVNRLPNDMIQFALNHYGHGSINSNIIPIKSGKTNVIEVEMGSLYPPKYHPYFSGWSEVDIARVKTSNRIIINGVEVLNNLQSAYDAPPQSVKLGYSPNDKNTKFSGLIGKSERFSTTFKSSNEYGLWSLDITLPANLYRIGQPLLASGFSGHGNMLLIESLSEKEIRFGFDEWGIGKFSNSNTIQIDNSKVHRIEIFVGPKLIKQKIPENWSINSSDILGISNDLQVWLDGKMVWTTTIHGNANSYDSVGVGTNAQGFSTAQSLFAGQLRKNELTDNDKKELLLRCIAAANKLGLLRLSIKMPENSIGIGQPLMTTGIPGNGCLLLIKAISKNEIRLSLDEWGANIFTDSGVINLDNDKEHDIEIVIGPKLHQEIAKTNYEFTQTEINSISNQLQVWLDKKLIWNKYIQSKNVNYNNIEIGTNKQGFSTAQKFFEGNITNTPISEYDKKDIIRRAIDATSR